VRKRLLAGLLAAASLAALVAAAASRPQGFAVPAGVELRAKESAPLLGTAWNEAEKRTELVHVDPDSLQALPEPSLRVGNYGTTWAYSPGRERLALAAHTDSRRGLSASLQVVDPATLRRQLALSLGYGQVFALAWLEPDRVLVLRLAYHPERLEVLTVAPSAKRVLARTTLDGELHGAQRTRDALVLLLSPAGRIGVGTLVVVSANGDVRAVALERIWIGYERPDTSTDDYFGTQRGAGFAVDPDRGRAFVFPAGSDAAAVDLETLAVTYHSLVEPVSLFGRLRAFLDPSATAKVIDGPWRSARWVGGGMVALTGVDSTTWKDRDSRRQWRSTPAGLTLVDTNTWRARTLDRGASSASFADGLLLVTGGSYDSTAQSSTSMGLAAYDLEGTRRFRLFEDRLIYVRQVFRGRAYVIEEKEPIRVVEIGSGRIVDTRRDVPPWLFIGDAASD
jgi:hypothetical protein